MNKHILLGVTGSIAAYKSAELVRLLRDAGAEVQVVMTRAAAEFITPLTMQALSGRPVQQHLLDADAEAGMGHITLARWADLIIVAPASADFIARLAQGRADDLLGSICLVTTSPIAIAPAMNHQMWNNQATQHNVDLLSQREIAIFGPGIGDQACGESGPGRMLEPVELAGLIAEQFESAVLSGLRVLITAGPTQEDIDPVRFVSNRSSGKMGFALARAAAEAGARVTLISGPVALTTPARVARIDVRSAAQMQQQVIEQAKDHDIFIASAAVADYRPAETATQKMKKNSDALTLTLQKTADIVASVAAGGGPGFIVGFAAETENLEANALKKLQTKSLDMVAANLVGQPGSGFESDDNALTILWEDGRRDLPLASKETLARELISIIAERYHAKCTTKGS